jgi:hypothetical protein
MHGRTSSMDEVLAKNYTFAKSMLYQSAIVEKQVKAGMFVCLRVIVPAC